MAAEGDSGAAVGVSGVLTLLPLLLRVGGVADNLRVSLARSLERKSPMVGNPPGTGEALGDAGGPSTLDADAAEDDMTWQMPSSL